MYTMSLQVLMSLMVSMSLLLPSLPFPSPPFPSLSRPLAHTGITPLGTQTSSLRVLNSTIRPSSSNSSDTTLRTHHCSLTALHEHTYVCTLPHPDCMCVCMQTETKLFIVYQTAYCDTLNGSAVQHCCWC